MKIDSYLTKHSFNKLKHHFDNIETNYHKGIKIHTCTLNDLEYNLVIQPEFKETN